MTFKKKSGFRMQINELFILVKLILKLSLKEDYLIHLILYERTNLNNKNVLLNHNSSYEFGLNEPMKNKRNQTHFINLIGNNFLGPNIVQNNPAINLSNVESKLISISYSPE
jgi:hypothetical protein